MKKILVTTASARIGVNKNARTSILKDQTGVNIVEFLLIAAILVVLALLVVPNLNLFLGIDTKLAAANTEALNVRAAAIAYRANPEPSGGGGKYPSDSDALWQEPPRPGDYIGQPRAYYTFDIGTGRILDATMDTPEHIPADPWAGIRWDYTSGSWVKE